jgi:hypothetical protein
MSWIWILIHSAIFSKGPIMRNQLLVNWVQICLKIMNLFFSILKDYYENYGPWGLLHHYCYNLKSLCCDLLHSFSIFHIQFNLAIDRREIDNLSFALDARVCYLCAGAAYVVLLGSPTGSITLVSWLREILGPTVLHHPLLLGEIPTRERQQSHQHQSCVRKTRQSDYNGLVLSLSLLGAWMWG